MAEDPYKETADIMRQTPNGRAMLAHIECLSAEITRLREAAKMGIDVANRWLDSGECDCEMDHVCGRPQLERERDRMQSLVDYDA